MCRSVRGVPGANTLRRRRWSAIVPWRRNRHSCVDVARPVPIRRPSRHRPANRAGRRVCDDRSHPDLRDAITGRSMRDGLHRARRGRAAPRRRCSGSSPQLFDGPLAPRRCPSLPQRTEFSHRMRFHTEDRWRLVYDVPVFLWTTRTTLGKCSPSHAGGPALIRRAGHCRSHNYGRTLLGRGAEFVSTRPTSAPRNLDRRSFKAERQGAACSL
jgi:hypothetical protein